MVTGKKQKNGSAKGQLFFSDVKNHEEQFVHRKTVSGLVS